MRAECQTLENAASYVRRFVQGRLDIVAAARSGNTVATPEDISAALAGGDPSPDATAGESGHRMPRPQADMTTDHLPSHLLDQLNDIISIEDLVRINAVDRGRLDVAFDELTVFEQRVSSDRKLLHEIIDTLQSEIVRRYRTGEATVDGLLT